MRSVLAAVLFAASAHAAQPSMRAQTVYGQDDRKDLYQVDDARLKTLADSTVGIFFGPAVRTEKDGTSKLLTLPYGKTLGLCKDERFYAQRMAAFCTGFLVAPDVVATAGHCVRSPLVCPFIKFVFGYSLDREGQDPTRLASRDVYGCSHLIARRRVPGGPDWALVRLDRPVEGHAPLALDPAGDPPEGDPLVLIGHPDGLPTKIAAGARVRGGSADRFVANLDAFNGNSGSPVFDGRTGLVEGILVDGDKDFEWEGLCREAHRCPDNGCKGEEVVRSSVFIHEIPKLSPKNLESLRLCSPVARIKRFRNRTTVGSLEPASYSALGSPQS